MSMSYAVRRRRIAASRILLVLVLPDHHTEEQAFGLCAGNVEGQLEIVSGSLTG